MIPAPASWAWRAPLLAAVACFVVLFGASAAQAEQASSGARPTQAGYLDAGDEHTCALLADRSLRCWGKGLAGRLGYGNEANVLSGAAAAPVNLGAGRTGRAVVAGDYHTCAIADDGTVHCWGFGANGRLGYGSTANVLSPAAAPAVDLGGRRAVAITAGASHTCVIVDDGTVRCWGNGVSGRLGYGNQATIGDNESPAAAGAVDIGPGRRAVAISAGDFHTCAVRDDGALVCWGFGSAGQLGRGGTADVGDDETPGQAGPVPMGGRAVRAVSGGKGHTCVVLDDGTARCWGFGADGRLGYGSEADILTASAAPPVNLGPGRTAVAISAGEAHTCAILDTGAVRCWGFGGNGRLGTDATASIGDTAGESPASAPPVALGGGRVARAISIGFSHSCALLDDGTLRCWGFGGSGRLGYGGESSIGDDPARSVAAAGPVPVPAPGASSLADLTLGITPGAVQVPVGGVATVTVRVANGGPDAAVGVAVSLPPPPGLSYRTAGASQGAFDGGAGAWQVGTLGPGAAATLSVTVAGVAAGSRAIAAEVSSSAIFDPTSTPGNGGAEDDRAVATVEVLAAPGGTQTVKLAPRGLSLQVTRAPKRGKVRTLSVTGRLVMPRTRPAPRCTGRVRVRAMAGKRVVASRTVALRARRGVCRFATVLRPKRLRSAKQLTVRAQFLGTPQLKARSAKVVKVRVVVRPASRR
jgi:alpha-tubulin suppressor-like RCC1 family protein